MIAFSTPSLCSLGTVLSDSPHSPRSLARLSSLSVSSSCCVSYFPCSRNHQAVFRLLHVCEFVLFACACKGVLLVHLLDFYMPLSQNGDNGQNWGYTYIKSCLHQHPNNTGQRFYQFPSPGRLVRPRRCCRCCLSFRSFTSLCALG